MAIMRFFLVAVAAMTLVQLTLGLPGHDDGDATTHRKGKPEKTIKPHASEVHRPSTNTTIPTETQSAFENVGEHAGSYEPGVVSVSSRDDEVEWPSDAAASLADATDNVEAPVGGSESASDTQVDVEFEDDKETEDTEIDEVVVSASRELDWLAEYDEDDSTSRGDSPATQAPTKSSAHHHHESALSGFALVATAVLVVAHV